MQILQKQSQKVINSYATYKNSHRRSKERVFYSPLGGSTDVEVLGENHHKINLIVGEDPLLYEDVVPLLWITSYTALLSR